MSYSVNMVAQGLAQMCSVWGQQLCVKMLVLCRGEGGCFVFACREVQSKLEATGRLSFLLYALALEVSGSGGQKATAELSEC